MITLDDYFGVWHVSDEELQANARDMLESVNDLMRLALADGVEFKINPRTHSCISGSTLGGYRPATCAVGAPSSAHRQALAVDIYDPDNTIDDWCIANRGKLEACGIYLEHPDATLGWSHWTIRAPKSGNRVFYP